MKRFKLIMVGCLILGLIGGLQLAQAQVPSVYSLPIRGEIEPGLAAFVARGLAVAERNEGVLLLEINTFGGRVDAATEIKDLLFKAKVPVIAYVSERAWSAGALIALSAPQVAMAPGSSMGAAEPRPLDEKTVSALRAEFEATAAKAGRNPRLAGAMVDADIVIEELVEKGKILTLSAEDAIEWGMADVLAESRHEVLVHYGYTNYELIPLTPHWAERVSRFITTSTVSSLLLTLGFIGLIFEITTPGWGVPGTAGLVALALFFGGRYVTGLAGFEEIGLFVLGLLLLLLEIFVIPGFGLAGIGGIVAIVVSVVLVFGNIQAALTSLFIALSASILAFILLWNRIKKSRFWQRLVLAHSETKEEGYQAPADFSYLLGKRGMSLTPLRPSGTIVIDDLRYDAVSEGGFIAHNSLVEVVLLEGTRIVVRELINE